MFQVGRKDLPRQIISDSAKPNPDTDLHIADRGNGSNAFLMRCNVGAQVPHYSDGGVHPITEIGSANHIILGHEPAWQTCMDEIEWFLAEKGL